MMKASRFVLVALMIVAPAFPAVAQNSGAFAEAAERKEALLRPSVRVPVVASDEAEKLPPSAAAVTYRCTDGDGKTIYSDRPCLGMTVEMVKVSSEVNVLDTSAVREYAAALETQATAEAAARARRSVPDSNGTSSLMPIHSDTSSDGSDDEQRYRSYWRYDGFHDYCRFCSNSGEVNPPPLPPSPPPLPPPPPPKPAPPTAKAVGSGKAIFGPVTRPGMPHRQ